MDNWKLALAIAAMMLHATPQPGILQNDNEAMQVYLFEEYYQGTENLQGDELHEKIYDIVRNHTVVNYYSVWDHLRYIDEDPLNENNVILFYLQRSHDENDTCGDGNDCTSESWNREHVWPKSHGDFGTTMSKVAGTDLHALRPVDNTINSARSDKDFGESEVAHSECTQCDVSTQAWEPADATKGDAARSVFYMDIRYNGFGQEPSLSLMNNWTEPSEDEGSLGKICTLYSWHYQDPVSEYEVERNNRVYEIQGNRNPFIDNYEFVEGIWGDTCDEWGNGAIEYTSNYSTMEIGPSDRTAMLTMPGGHDYNRPLPLVIGLHGFSGSGWWNSYYMGLFDSILDNEHLLLWPNGSLNSVGIRFWNATDACCADGITQSDDVEWLDELINEAIISYGADPEGIIFIGHSNGGFMSHRMACERGDMIHSIVSLAGATYNDFSSDCGDSGRPNILNIHGTNDGVILYEGGYHFNWDGFSEYPSANLSTSYWAERSGCEESLTNIGVLDLVYTVNEEETTMFENLNCEEGNRVALWSINDGGHNPGFNDGVFANKTLEWALNGFSRDSDGDSYRDNTDLFHLNPNEWNDSDGDGTGDNSDVFPLNESENADTDGDGVGDNSDIFPNDASEITDLDGDGVGDNADLDDDGDGWSDYLEVECLTNPDDLSSVPLDTNEDGECDVMDEDDDGDGWSDYLEVECLTNPDDLSSVPLDTNEDGECDVMDEDDDGDGAIDTEDKFPLDINEKYDLDGDGVGDNEDLDDDGDGWSDYLEVECLTNPADVASVPLDTDEDGECDVVDEDDDGDLWMDENELDCGTNSLDYNDIPLDTDADKICDLLDEDDDGDLTLDSDDAFPLDFSEDTDTDLDNIGNNADTDDDNDMISDLDEYILGTDPLDSDTDDDGFPDSKDDYPLDSEKHNAAIEAAKSGPSGFEITLMMAALATGIIVFRTRKAHD